MDHYILKDEVPIRVGLMEWAVWLETVDNRRVDFTQVNPSISVSTVFIGLGHMFETMVFGPDGGFDEVRTDTIEQAREAHRETVKRIMESEND